MPLGPHLLEKERLISGAPLLYTPSNLTRKTDDFATGMCGIGDRTCQEKLEVEGSSALKEGLVEDSLHFIIPYRAQQHWGCLINHSWMKLSSSAISNKSFHTY